MPALIAWWTQDVEPTAPLATRQEVVDAGARLLGRWTEPHRAYHSTRHLVEMFWALEELEEAGQVTAAEARTARIAAWFHDAVYDASGTGGDTGEQESARLARQQLTGLGVAPQVVDEVERLVLLTQQHRAPAGDRVGAAFCDADLWILGADADRYGEYTVQVRQEYAHMPEAAFRAGRRAVLQQLTAGDVYATDHARRAWGPAARQNTGRELTALG